MIFDIIFAILLIWGAYKGITKGFVKQLASLAALVIGIWGAYKFSGFTSEVLFKHSDNQYIPIISFSITFIAIIVLVNLLGKLLDTLLKSISVNIFNRIVGGVFGVAMFAFIISIVLMVVNRINEQIQFLPEEKQKESVLYVPLSQFAPKIFPYLKFEKLQDTLKQEKEATSNEEKSES
jgi:membrane protein required for colicin V production